MFFLLIFVTLNVADVLYAIRHFHKPAFSNLTWQCIWTNGLTCATSVENRSDRNLSYDCM